MSNTTKTKFSTNVLAIATLVTAIGGFITILFNTGVLGNEKKKSTTEEVKESKIDSTQRETDTTIKDQATQPVVYKAEKTEAYNLTGNWFDINNPKGKYYINHEGSGMISFTEYSLVFGEWISTATGSGTVENKKIDIPYTTYLGTNGRFKGEVLSDGKKIEGTVRDYSAGITIVLNIQKEN